MSNKITLGGSVFTHNAIEFDYCIAESIASLCAVCDEVVCLDAKSTDETIDVINSLKQKYNNLKVVLNANWECASDYNRLRLLADEAKSYVNTDWHFMLQADEVIHENSFPYIRKAIEHPTNKSYMVRRMNLWGDMNHYLRYDIPHQDKPVNDQVIRLATIDNPAYGDAESLKVDPKYLGWLSNEVIIFHYGFVRRDRNMINKAMSMQSWFFGPNSQPDNRIVEMSKKDNKRFEWEVLKSRDMLGEIYMPHPKFSQAWVSERQAEKIPVK